jgi:arylsulfatase A-like enzyme
MPDRKTAADVNDAFLGWLDGRSGQPFFAFLNYYDAHTPYLPPEPFAGRFRTGSKLLAQVPRQGDAHAPVDTVQVQAALDSYEAAIAYLDDQLGRLFAELDRRGVLANTLVVVTADHGEEFMEHGVAEHGNSLYLPSLHVPLIVTWPGRVPAGLRLSHPVGIRQLAATIMDLTGSDGHSPFPGPSLASGWAVPAPPTNTPPIFNQVGHATGLPDWYPVSKGDMFAVLDGGLRLIRNGDGAVELYDFQRDPGERTNLAGDSVRQAAMTRLAQMVDDIRPRQR